MFDELYQEIVFDHAKSKEQRSTESQEQQISESLGSYKMYNPICGDQVQFFTHIKNEKDGAYVQRVRYEASGCALSQAGASMIAKIMEGKNKEEAIRLVEQIQIGIVQDDTVLTDQLGDIMAFKGVKEFPMRIKCATLGLHAFKKSLEAGDE